jgi:hypothetical protein
MDYSKFSNTIFKKVMTALALINNPEISPEVRQLNQEILFREVGTAVYSKVYDMNAFDMEIEHTRGPGIDDRHFGMAKVAAASVSTGALGLDEYVKNYLDNTIGKAQKDAMTNARQSGKRPTVTRIENGNACKWCKSKAGTFTDPPPDVFARHGGCEAQIRTSGYRSRNGLLDNYVKPSDR